MMIDNACNFLTEILPRLLRKSKESRVHYFATNARLWKIDAA
jgi:hypothetical protein